MKNNTYYCIKCKRNHLFSSNAGRIHSQFGGNLITKSIHTECKEEIELRYLQIKQKNLQEKLERICKSMKSYKDITYDPDEVYSDKLAEAKEDFEDTETDLSTNKKEINKLQEIIKRK